MPFMADSMTITLTPDLEDFVKSKVAAGRYRSVIEVIQQGLRLLEDMESIPDLPISELRAQIAVGIGQADRGELVDGEEVFEDLLAGQAPTS